MAHASPHGKQAHFSVPQPMPWPVMGSASLFMIALALFLGIIARYWFNS